MPRNPLLKTNKQLLNYMNELRREALREIKDYQSENGPEVAEFFRKNKEEILNAILYSLLEYREYTLTEVIHDLLDDLVYQELDNY